jgi:hypothetical protein
MHCPATDPAAAVQLTAVIVPTSHTYHPPAFHPLTWLVRCADMAAARHTVPCGICVCLLSDTCMYACVLGDACMHACLCPCPCLCGVSISSMARSSFRGSIPVLCVLQHCLVCYMFFFLV